ERTLWGRPGSSPAVVPSHSRHLKIATRMPSAIPGPRRPPAMITPESVAFAAGVYAAERSLVLRRDDPHGEVLCAPAVCVTESVLDAVHRAVAGAAHHLQGGLAQAEHARGADRVRAEDPPRGIDREVRAEALLTPVDDAPALSEVAEAEVLEP